MVCSLKREMRILKHVGWDVRSVEKVSKIRKNSRDSEESQLSLAEAYAKKQALEPLENNKSSQKATPLEENRVQQVLELWNARARPIHP